MEAPFSRIRLANSPPSTPKKMVNLIYTFSTIAKGIGIVLKPLDVCVEFWGLIEIVRQEASGVEFLKHFTNFTTNAYNSHKEVCEMKVLPPVLINEQLIIHLTN